MAALQSAFKGGACHIIEPAGFSNKQGTFERKHNFIIRTVCLKVWFPLDKTNFPRSVEGSSPQICSLSRTAGRRACDQEVQGVPKKTPRMTWLSNQLHISFSTQGLKTSYWSPFFTSKAMQP